VGNYLQLVNMLYKTLSAAVYGIDANIIQVEVDCSGIKCDQDHFHTVGLPDAAVRESRDRVRAALKNCGYDIPPTHITINLAPADIKKEGSGFDLPMALGIVGAYGGLTKKEMTDCLFVGELSLDGGVRPSPSPLKPADRKFPAWSSRKPTPRKRPWSEVWMSTPCARCST
jgi:magnesium chelatase family protein